MFARFFVDRPIFATVLSILITLGGSLAIFTLPVAQYPDITPPTVEVSAYYPGANSQTVADTVAAPIEQQVNGVEGMMYMSSQSTNDGTYTLTVTFKSGTNLNLAQLLVQNRVALAQPILPDLVNRRGVSVKKKSPSILMMINLYSPDKSRKPNYLSNYATIQLRDELLRLNGIGDITILGQRDYSMRIWLDPEKLAARGLTASDVIRTIQQQNIQVAAGQIGQPPVAKGQPFQYTINTLGRLSTADQFSEMVIKTDNQGRLVRIRHVASVELGALNYDINCTLGGLPCAALSIYQLPGTNALKTAKLVRDKMDELKQRFPSGVDFKIVYDTTPFITESINEVFKTLRDAVILVAIVVLVFLQNWRSAIIPLIAVPVAIIGTFAAMAILNFSLNNLTLFGLVLAIGIVVDDAIVVVEAINHHIEHGMSPRDATIQAMDEVSGPVIAIGLVLTAVFIPCTFITGIVGEFFRQFALTIAISTLLSAFNSLTLSPALAALLLRRPDEQKAEALPGFGYFLIGSWIGWEFIPQSVTHFIETQIQPKLQQILNNSLNPILEEYIPPFFGAIVAGFVLWSLRHILNYLLVGFFYWFNRCFTLITRGYTFSVRYLLKISPLILLGFGGLLYQTYDSFMTTPTGFIPPQDKGYLIVNLRMRNSAALEQTDAIMLKMDEIARGIPGVKHTITLTGQSLLLGANAPNFGSMYVMLDEFHERAKKHLSADVIASQLQEAFDSQIDDGQIRVFGSPPVDGLGTAGGFKYVILDRINLGMDTLQDVGDQIVRAGNKNNPFVENLFSSFRADTPWYYLNIDRIQAKSLGVSISEVFNSLQSTFGALYINDFNRFGRTWQVTLQASEKYRESINDLKRVRIRSDRGAIVPLHTFAEVEQVNGPLLITRYNMYQAAFINGNPKQGVSTSEAISTIEEISNSKLIPSMKAEWTELTLLQLQAGNTAMFAFALAVVLVFLVLAAQYESWSLPLAVILVVPMCLLCAVSGVVIAEMDINIFTQIGFVVLVGLACKNAILIVEFAKQRRDAGSHFRQAILEACDLRFRPIMMTSFAFILGVVPLLVSEGAGAEMRQMLGTAVFSGMLGVTLFGIFLTPVFTFVIQWVLQKKQMITESSAIGDGSNQDTNAIANHHSDGSGHADHLPHHENGKPHDDSNGEYRGHH